MSLLLNVLFVGIGERRAAKPHCKSCAYMDYGRRIDTRGIPRNDMGTLCIATHLLFCRPNTSDMKPQDRVQDRIIITYPMHEKNN